MVRSSRTNLTTSARYRGQRAGVAGQEPAAVGPSAVNGDPMADQFRRFSAGARCHGQRVPAPCEGDVADDYYLFQLADATDPRLLVSGREAGEKSIPAEWRSAWIQKHDIVGHQAEQADKVASVDCIKPSLRTSRMACSSDPICNLHCQKLDHATITAPISIDRRLSTHQRHSRSRNLRFNADLRGGHFPKI